MRAEIANKIEKIRNFKALDLSNMQIQDDEIAAILEKIGVEAPHLSNLDLDLNALTDKGAGILSEYLSHFQNLAVLSLQFNKIGKEGALGIFGLKKRFEDLDILFRGNAIQNTDEMDEIERLAVQGRMGVKK